MQMWRRDCSRRPAVASTRARARSAVEAPGGHVAGVLDVAGAVGDDELAVRRGGVAVGHVDGDALLALGPQPVGDEGQVDLAQAPALRRRRRWHRPGRRRAGGCRRAAGRSGCSSRRRPTRWWRSATGPWCRRRAPGRRPAASWASWLMVLEVPLALAVLHGRLGEPVVAPGGAPLGDPGGRHLADDVLDRGRPRSARPRSAWRRPRCGSAPWPPRRPRRPGAETHSLTASSMPSRSMTRRSWA